MSKLYVLEGKGEEKERGKKEKEEGRKGRGVRTTLRTPCRKFLATLVTISCTKYRRSWV